MGWQKIGEQMNSLSWQMFALEGYLEKILQRCVFAKKCHTCINAEEAEGTQSTQVSRELCWTIKSYEGSGNFTVHQGFMTSINSLGGENS